MAAHPPTSLQVRARAAGQSPGPAPLKTAAQSPALPGGPLPKETGGSRSASWLFPHLQARSFDPQCPHQWEQVILCPQKTGVGGRLMKGLNACEVYAKCNECKMHARCNACKVHCTGSGMLWTHVVAGMFLHKLLFMEHLGPGAVLGRGHSREQGREMSLTSWSKCRGKRGQIIVGQRGSAV